MQAFTRGGFFGALCFCFFGFLFLWLLAVLPFGFLRFCLLLFVFLPCGFFCVFLRFFAFFCVFVLDLCGILWYSVLAGRFDPLVGSVLCPRFFALVVFMSSFSLASLALVFPAVLDLPPASYADFIGWCGGAFLCDGFDPCDPCAVFDELAEFRMAGLPSPDRADVPGWGGFCFSA